MTSTIGKRVRIETFDDIYEGVAIDVDESGALIIRDDSGDRKKYHLWRLLLSK
jgi:BirA family transcriptional regulator, biotin operon repressor / biotin---[acetyl-CoA-carboxylase] ligase